MLRTLLVLLFAGTTLTASAQQSGLPFLRLGPDARGLSLGDAGVSFVQGAFAAERNPAGLALGDDNTVALTHHRWFADEFKYGISGRFRIGASTGVGLYVRAAGTGGIEARDRPGPSDGTFDVQFVAAGVALGRQIGPVRVGVAAKYLSERIFSVSATGLALDAGVQASFAADAIRIGATLQHVGSMTELADRPTELPRTVRVGAAVHPFRVLAFDDASVLVDAYLSAEWSHNTVDALSQWHLGASARVLETLDVTVGYVSGDAVRSYSLGTGLEVGAFGVEYAVIPFAGFGGPGHIFSLVYRL